ncbi:MAG: hypothetical protein JXR86_10005 [Spirochaetales bacterium]|nr:hypothetical protein [Spirochaetales bacterium]
MKENRFEIEFTSLHGHLAYTLECPLCGEFFKKHTVCYPAEISCPFCRARFTANKPFHMSPGIHNRIIYFKMTS